MRRLTGLGSALGALGAAGSTTVAAVVCCAGPFAYGLLGAGGVLVAARAQRWAPWVLGASVLLLALAFWSLYRRRRDGASCPARAGRAVRAVVWGAAVLTVVAGLVTLTEGIL